jgi:hypothetical protein
MSLHHDEARGGITYILEVAQATGRPGYAHFTSRSHGEIAFDDALKKAGASHIRLIQAEAGRQTTLMEHTANAERAPAEGQSKPKPIGVSAAILGTLLAVLLAVVAVLFIAGQMIGQ